MTTELTAPSAEQQIDVIKRLVAPEGTTDAELQLFLMYCQRTGLDPIARQIWFSERRSKDPRTGQWTIKRVPETTIDGFRLCAERSGEYEGQTIPQWCGKDAQWLDVWLDDAPPAAARVGIWRKGFREPVYAVALYREYVQLGKSDNGTPARPVAMWAKMPAGQLAKCAESLALRKAFPRDFSGIYTREEMAQAERPEDAQRQIADERIATLAAEPVLQIEAPTPPTPPTPSAGKSKKAAAPFDMLAPFAEIKKAIMELAGPEPYYKVLADFGYAKSNEIPDKETGRKVYKALAQVRADLHLKTDMLSQLKHAAEVLGIRAFSQILGNNGQECAEDIVTLEAEQQAKILAEIELAVKDKIGSEVK